MRAITYDSIIDFILFFIFFVSELIGALFENQNNKKKRNVNQLRAAGG